MQNSRVISQQHRESSFKKPGKFPIFLGLCTGASTLLLLRRTSESPRSAKRVLGREACLKLHSTHRSMASLLLTNKKERF